MKTFEQFDAELSALVKQFETEAREMADRIAEKANPVFVEIAKSSLPDDLKLILINRAMAKMDNIN